MGKAVGKQNPHEETRKDEKISGSSTRHKGREGESRTSEINAAFFKGAAFCGISNTIKRVAKWCMTGRRAISFYPHL